MWNYPISLTIKCSWRWIQCYWFQWNNTSQQTFVPSMNNSIVDYYCILVRVICFSYFLDHAIGIGVIIQFCQCRWRKPEEYWNLNHMCPTTNNYLYNHQNVRLNTTTIYTVKGCTVYIQSNWLELNPVSSWWYEPFQCILSRINVSIIKHYQRINNWL